jgi:DNA-binding GntR family transcriptional regulator
MTPPIPEFPPLGRETLYEQAYERLKYALMSGEFSPGQGITLRAVAAALGTSPMPVRDALRRLQTEGAIVANHNRTLSVPRMTQDALIELRDVRIALEGLATEKAAALIDADQLDEVARSCAAMQGAAEHGDAPSYAKHNWAFHTGIYRASRSQLLFATIEPLWMRIGPYVRLMMPDVAALLDSMDSHWRALEALRRRDALLARASIVKDICDSAESLARALSAADGAAASDERSATAGGFATSVRGRRRGRPRKVAATSNPGRAAAR